MEHYHIFFDLDRTLWDFEKNSKNALKALYKKHVKPLTKISFLHFHKEYKKINAELWADYGKKKITKTDLRINRFTNSFSKIGIENPNTAQVLSEEYIKTSPFQTILMPQAIETLKTIKQRGYHLHILTNGFKEVQHIKLRESGLLPYFETIVCSEESGYSKPDPRVFEFALQKANAKRQTSLMIGDDYTADYKGALSYGIKAIYFNNLGLKRVRKTDNVVNY
ncbi:MAG: putative hydrolase of the HAD superfamily, partial [Psychromonas sp.]